MANSIAIPIVSMKRIFPLALILATVLSSGCADLYPSRVDNRDFALDTYSLSPPLIERASSRAQRFWAKHSARYGADPNLLAVEAYLVDMGELGVSFRTKLDHSETSASAFQAGIQTDAISVTCVILFDTKTNKPYTDTSYIFVDTPSIGTVIHVGNLVARYIGRGG
jgi:hypothetical protein